MFISCIGDEINNDDYLKVKLNFDNGVQLGASGEFNKALIEFREAWKNYKYRILPAKLCLNVINNVNESKTQEQAATLFFTAILQEMKGHEAYFSALIKFAKNESDIDFTGAHTYWENAIKLYRESISIDRDFAAAHYYLGDVLAVRGFKDQSKHSFDKARRINPNIIVYYSHVRSAYKVIEDQMIKKEISEYKERLSQDSQNVIERFKLAEFCRNMGHKGYFRITKDEALYQYNKILDIDPSYASAHYSLSLLYWGWKPDLAIRHFDKSKELGYDINIGYQEAIERIRKKLN